VYEHAELGFSKLDRAVPSANRAGGKLEQNDGVG